MHLSKPPTPFEYAIVFYGLAILLTGLGLAGLFAASGVEPEKAALLHRTAPVALVLGILLGAGTWIFRRFMDS
ncbi:MAG: hypothetical protein U1F98_12320 [Verrucomicrobiota bacterium]